jgi:hypothetical protein
MMGSNGSRYGAQENKRTRFDDNGSSNGNGHTERIVPLNSSMPPSGKFYAQNSYSKPNNGY